MLQLLTEPASWIAFAALSLLETVLGIDNVIFLAILVARLPPERRPRARVVGLGLAMITRVGLLFSVIWLTRLTAPWFAIFARPVSGRDLIMGCGGLFLIAKSVLEIHKMLEGAATQDRARAVAGFVSVVAQIAVIDIVFSLDSVFTAVGLAAPNQVPIMVAAIVASMVAMMWLSGPIATFVERHVTVKVLALAFLILVGVALVAEGMRFHIPKAYLYFAMAFAVVVEMINLRLRKLLDGRRRRHSG
jgi:predicted tellurium resistance membrane protein TerC